mmetsp:Transcript_48441/g.113360  ORF Transcript_48441/g.113360 Transcript_48441/m.113360 type:complete len:204 (-) Transcript_48441:6529-7140(-)
MLFVPHVTCAFAVSSVSCPYEMVQLLSVPGVMLKAPQSFGSQMTSGSSRLTGASALMPNTMHSRGWPLLTKKVSSSPVAVVVLVVVLDTEVEVEVEVVTAVVGVVEVLVTTVVDEVEDEVLVKFGSGGPVGMVVSVVEVLVGAVVGLEELLTLLVVSGGGKTTRCPGLHCHRHDSPNGTLLFAPQSQAPPDGRGNVSSVQFCT